MIVFSDNYDIYEKYLVYDKYGAISDISDEAPDDIKDLFYIDRNNRKEFMEQHKDVFLEAIKIARGEKKKWQE